MQSQSLIDWLRTNAKRQAASWQRRLAGTDNQWVATSGEYDPAYEYQAVLGDNVAQFEFSPKHGEFMLCNADAVQVGGTHYKDMAIQPWAVMEIMLTHEEFVGFLKGNYLKYAMRAGHKGDASEDAKKAQHYAQKLREVTK